MYRSLAFGSVVGLSILASASALASDTDKIIKIGVLSALSGPNADLGGPGALVAAKMAAEEVGNKVGDQAVEVINADLQNKPDVASAVARRWFDTEGIDMIVDVPLTSAAFAVQNIGREFKKVVMINGAASEDLTKAECSPYSVHWSDDSQALSAATARVIRVSGAKNWFFLTPDYAWGHLLEKSASKVITSNGGTIKGSAKFPFGNSDFSSQLISASSSGADVFGSGTVGTDTLNLVKQANEFQLLRGNKRLVVFQVFLTEIHALGLDVAKGMYVTDGFYWDQNEETRAFSKKFFERHGRMPTKSQATTYLSVRHYLAAVKEANSQKSDAVIKAMRSIPVYNFGDKAYIRPNGRVMYDLNLYEVKKPADSKYPWDYYRKVDTLPAQEAFGGSDTDTCSRT